MKWTASRLIPTILGGGVVLGLLASTAISTLPKAPPDPPWRLAAREAAFKPSGYSYVDHGPIDLSPALPWIGTGPAGSVAPLPEDYYRGRVIPIRAGDQAVIPDPVPVHAEPAGYAVDGSDRPVAPPEGSAPVVRRAVVDEPDAPLFTAEQAPAETADDSDLGG